LGGIKVSDKSVGYIENGVVIDHLPRGIVWRVAEILGVDKLVQGRVSLGDGYTSHRLGGEKSFIKIERVTLSDYQLNLIALIAGNATVSIIEAGEVKEKRPILIPSRLEGIIVCPNSGCISNDDSEPVSSLISYGPNSGFCCDYCETRFGRDQLRLC
jgi:aspartate carbamoyltransferase regulatory subunit